MSIGIQSFQDALLEHLGRTHSSIEAKQAVAMAKIAGFDDINLDLMHGLPQQSTASAINDLKTAIHLQPQHISWYQLTIEPNTPFYQKQLTLPADEILADIEVRGFNLLKNNGYERYEVSAFAQNTRESRHNKNYWQFGDYLGIGAGAHGKFTDIVRGQIVRRQKTRLPEHYVADKLNISFKESIVANNQLPLEFFMNTLRLVEGVPSNYFEMRTGLNMETIAFKLDKLKKKKLLVNRESQLQTTNLGLRFLNTVIGEFIENKMSKV